MILLMVLRLILLLILLILRLIVQLILRLILVLISNHIFFYNPVRIFYENMQKTRPARHLKPHFVLQPCTYFE